MKPSVFFFFLILSACGETNLGDLKTTDSGISNDADSGTGNDGTAGGTGGSDDAAVGNDAPADTSPAPSDCSPQNTGACSNSPSGALCCPFRGNIYVWDAAAQCRVLAHAASDKTPFECMDTGSTYSPYNACSGGAALSCYEKNTTDGKLLIMLSPYTWPTGYLLLSEWTQCSFDLYTQVDQAPDCT